MSAAEQPWWQASQDGMDHVEVASFEDSMTTEEYATYREWQGDPIPATPAAEPEEEATPEVVAEIHRQHRRYAISQIKAKRDTMARELARDSASGKLTGLARVRAAARLASYNDLIDCLTKLKGLS